MAKKKAVRKKVVVRSVTPRKAVRKKRISANLASPGRSSHHQVSPAPADRSAAAAKSVQQVGVIYVKVRFDSHDGVEVFADRDAATSIGTCEFFTDRPGHAANVRQFLQQLQQKILGQLGHGLLPLEVQGSEILR
jgi:hypothetical protein